MDKYTATRAELFKLVLDAIYTAGLNCDVDGEVLGRMADAAGEYFAEIVDQQDFAAEYLPPPPDEIYVDMEDLP